MHFLLVVLIALNVNAFARPSVRKVCELPLTFVTRYAKLAQLFPEPARANLWRTKLINLAFIPGMERLRRAVFARSPRDLQAVARKRARWMHQFLLDPPKDPLVDGERPFAGGESWEPGFFIRELGSHGPLMAPWVPSNRSEVSRLARAAKVVLHFAHELGSPFTEDHQFLERHSFTKMDFEQALHVGALTTLQAISFLSANAIEGLTTEELVRQITTAHPPRPSLVVQLALLAPPLFMGHYAGRVTRTDVLTGPSGALDLSPSLRAKLNVARERWRETRKKPPFEFGHGCPVAHAKPGDSESALQGFVDAMMYARDALAQEPPRRRWW